MAWDVFISHATENKETLARPLAAALHLRGVSVWLDEAQLRVGTTLSQGIRAGLAGSRYVILVLTEDFLRKDWTRRELAEAIESHRSHLLPFLGPGMTITRLADFSPTLADVLAARPPGSGASSWPETSAGDISEVAAMIAAVVKRPLGLTDDTAERLREILLRIHARHWIRFQPPGLINAIASVHDTMAVVRSILSEAGSAIELMSPGWRHLPLAYVPMEGAVWAAWESALVQAAQMNPRALAAVLYCARARSSSPMPPVDELLNRILKEEPRS